MAISPIRAAVTTGLLVLAAVASSSAQEPSPGSAGYRVNVSQVQLYPVVKQGKRYVTHLNASDFIVLDHGQPVALESFARRVVSLRVALVVDVSESMTETLAPVRAATLRFVEQLASGDEVAVFAFNSQLRELVPATVDHERAKASLRGLSAGGGTAVYDAVIGVVDATSSPHHRNVVVLFSDGRDERSSATLDETIAHAEQAGALVYGLGAHGPALDRDARRALEQLADRTGGESFIIGKTKDLDGVFDRILTDLRAQYSLSYLVPPGPAGERSIAVKTRFANFDVRCRDRYVAEAD